MKRDGARTSIWQTGIPDYTSQTQELPARVDVVIVGGGITGVSLALELQKKGKACAILEAQGLGFGTTGGTTAHLNTMLDTPYTTIEKNFGEKEAQLVAQATKEAISAIQTRVDMYGIDCSFEKETGYLYSQNEDQTKELAKISEASLKAGIDLVYTNSIPVSVPFEKAILFDGQAQFHPLKYIHALAEEFEKLGGIIVQDCRVTDHEEGDLIEVTTSLGTLQTKGLVYATHIPPRVNLTHFKCAPYRSYVIAFSLEDDAYPDGLAYDMEDPYNYHRTQVIEGKKYVVLGGKDHKTAHETHTERFFDELEAYARKYYKVKEVVYRWSSQYFEPNDGIAYIGHLPGSEHVYVATGFSGNGMTYSQIAMLELSHLIVEGNSRYENLFAPSRMKLGGLGTFLKEQADVAGHYLKKLLPAESLEVFADLAHGEAKVVKHEGDSLALYKDEKGHLHALNSTCTHAYCSVAWNSAEKSWDCPCHGARYSFEGEVLTGPAQKGLEPATLNEEIGEEKA